MKKILLYRKGDAIKFNADDVGASIHDVTTADVVGLLNDSEDVVTIVKSNKRPYGYKMSLKEFSIQSLNGEI